MHLLRLPTLLSFPVIWSQMTDMTQQCTSYNTNKTKRESKSRKYIYSTSHPYNLKANTNNTQMSQYPFRLVWLLPAFKTKTNLPEDKDFPFNNVALYKKMHFQKFIAQIEAKTSNTVDQECKLINRYMHAGMDIKERLPLEVLSGRELLSPTLLP